MKHEVIRTSWFVLHCETSGTDWSRTTWLECIAIWGYAEGCSEWRYHAVWATGLLIAKAVDRRPAGHHSEAGPAVVFTHSVWHDCVWMPVSWDLSRKPHLYPSEWPAAVSWQDEEQPEADITSTVSEWGSISTLFPSGQVVYKNVDLLYRGPFPWILKFPVTATVYTSFGSPSSCWQTRQLLSHLWCTKLFGEVMSLYAAFNGELHDDD